MDKKRIWNISKLLFKLCLTATLIYLVFQKINYNQVKAIFLQSDPLYIFIALLLLFCSQVVACWRLTGFLGAAGITIPFISNLRLYFIGLFYNNFLPGGIGGDGYKIYLLNRKYKKPVKQIFLSVLFDRLSGLWAICMLMILCMFLLPIYFVSHAVLLFTLVAGSSLYYILVRYFFREYSDYLVSGHLKGTIAQSLQVLGIVMILFSQHSSGNLIPYIFSFLLSSVATAIPVSIGGAGIREFVMVKIAGPLQIDAALAVFTTLTFYFLSLIVSAPGLWYVWKKNEWNPLSSDTPAKSD